MEYLATVFIVGFIVLGIYKVFELFVRKSERITLIEKLPALLSADEVGKVIKFPEISFVKQGYQSWALRFALLFAGVGLGCLVAFFVQFGLLNFAELREGMLNDHEIMHMRFILYFSFITFCGSLGLFIAYLIEKSQSKKQKDAAE